MKRISTCSLIALLSTTPLFFSSCSSSDDKEGGNEGAKVASISGVAQKGQFLRGSSITIYALDKTLNASGLSYPTQTIDDLGSFTVNNVNADFIDVKANGYYYNENRGETSKSTINLQALAKSNSTVNVNLLTTLAYNRIKHLVAAGANFSDAQSRAQIEVLTALGLGNSTSANFTDMNIAGSGDANGLLLAASLLIQQDRSVGDVSKLISDIAADLEDDGLLSSDLNQEIHKYERNIYVSSIISDLIKFYEKNKVENFSIPTFYSFLDTDGDGKKDGEADFIFKSIGAVDAIAAHELMEINSGYSAGGFSLTEKFLSTIPFKAESDASWISIEKRNVAENIYAVDIVAQPNTGENRTAHVSFTDNSGKELKRYTYQQKAPDVLVPQRFVVWYSRENNFPSADVIGINGKTYNVVKFTPDTYYGYGSNNCWYVDMPYTDKQDRYQLYFPTDMLSMPDGYGMFKLSVPESMTSDVFPFVAQLENNVSNPARVIFRSASPSISVNVIDSYDHVVLTSDEPICGSANYIIRNGEIDLRNPQIIEQETHAGNNGQYKMTIQVRPNGNNHIPVLQCNALVHVQCYNSVGQLIHEYDDYSHDYIFNGDIQTR